MRNLLSLIIYSQIDKVFVHIVKQVFDVVIC